MAAPVTETETREIAELRRRLEDILSENDYETDHYLIRWIRARGHNLDKAEDLLRNHMKWRVENKVDSALNVRSDPFLTDNLPYWIKGRSKDNHVVWEVPFGEWDLRKIVDRPHGVQEFTFYSTQFMELMLKGINDENQRKIQSGNYPNTQFILLVDWAGYSYAQLAHWKALQGLLACAVKYEAHYPETVFKAFFINCPGIFSLVFPMIKALITPETASKIQIFGSKREEWETLIREEINPDQIGIQFGGICQDRTKDSASSKFLG